MQFMNAVEDACGRCRLEQVAGCPSLNTGQHLPFVSNRRNHQYVSFRVIFNDMANHVNAALVRQVGVNHHDVRQAKV